MLVEFASAVDAVNCAVAIQRAMIVRNADIPQKRRIEYRAGVNVGDIIVEHEDIYGDGVNIAARLEGIAEPGGVCISEDLTDKCAARSRRSSRPRLARPQEYCPADPRLQTRPQ